MSYPSEWMADDDGPAGLAVFMVDGIRHEMRLATFTAFLDVGKMLDAAFNQGKGFAFACTRDAIDRAMSDAKCRHAL